MPVSAEVRERVYSAADSLCAANAGEWPNVEEVRRASRVGMAAVVECMRDWRAKQRRPVAPIARPLPDELAALVQEAAQQQWATAQRLAEAGLAAQREALEAERAEILELSAQQSAAFEAQTAEVERLQAELSALAAKQAAAEAEARERLAKAGEALTAAREAAAQAKGELAGVRSLYGELLERLQTQESLPASDSEAGQSAKPKAGKVRRKAEMQLTL